MEFMGNAEPACFQQHLPERTTLLSKFGNGPSDPLLVRIRLDGLAVSAKPKTIGAVSDELHSGLLVSEGARPRPFRCAVAFAGIPEFTVRAAA